MGIQSTIEAAMSGLAPSLSRVALAVRENPQIVVDSTISELAALCDTSVASVVRFCHSIGFAGYAPLRRALATELGREATQLVDEPAYGSEIAEGDSVRDSAMKVARLELLGIEETVRNLDFAVLEQAADLVDDAHRILLYGVGASQLVAQDLGQKLLRIGRNALVLSDPHEAIAIPAVDAGPTVTISFSHAGTSQETVRFVENAGSRGIPTIGVTSVKGSTFARAVDVALFTEVRESSFSSGAMVSRMAQLAVVDCLFIGIAKRRYSDIVDSLRVTREATNQLRSRR